MKDQTIKELQAKVAQLEAESRAKDRSRESVVGSWIPTILTTDLNPRSPRLDCTTSWENHWIGRETSGNGRLNLARVPATWGVSMWLWYSAVRSSLSFSSGIQTAVRNACGTLEGPWSALSAGKQSNTIKLIGFRT